MPSDSEKSRNRCDSPEEPVAIVGVAALYPGARDRDEFWRLLSEEAPRAVGGSRGLDAVAVDVARFGIPPAQTGSMTRMQLLMLEAARQCLQDAGHPERPLPAERTDVVTGTCFGLDRQHANALRIEVSRYAREIARAAFEVGGIAEDGAHRAAEEFRTLMLRRLGGSPHDRVGEMASTIPARIAGAFKLRGRTLAVESADATSFVAIAHAVNCLRGGVSDAVLVLAGQRRESEFLARALDANGLLAPGPRPFAPDGRGFALGEGVGALLLKRLSSAVRDGDRIYASILDCSLRHGARPGAFRYSTSADHRVELAAASCRAAGVTPDSIQYAECAGTGLAREAAAEVAALVSLHDGAPPASVAVGSARDRLGHTFANAGLASVTKAALALHHRRLPPQWPPDEAEVDLSGTPLRLLGAGEDWRPGREGAARRAAVLGASLTGTLCHLILEEHAGGTGPAAPTAALSPFAAAAASAEASPSAGGTSPATATAVSATAVSEPAIPTVPEPIAIVGLGAWFAGSPDAMSFWRTIRSGRTRIAPVPESVLDRDLYHAPGALSLTHSYTDQGGHVPIPEAPPPALRIPPLRYAALDPVQRIALSVTSELLAGCDPRAGALGGSGLVAVGSNLGLSSERRANTELSLRDAEEAVAALAALADLSPVARKTVLALVRERYGPPDDPIRPGLVDGCLAGGVAALIANEYGLDAVPLAVEAACASSLAALDIAVGALRAGTADFAVAGGVELACNARDMVLCSALGLLSHGVNAPFDAGADGFTPGDGCGLFLLKRYRDALRDGDEILGLVRGIGASNDAKSLIAPDVEGQVRAMRQAFDQVDFAPAAVDYLEAHGTGTRVGDRVEIAAVARVYADSRRRRPLEIGSAKSFFGHTFAAAGSAGLLRTLLAMRAGTMPPNANLHTINPALDLPAIPAAVSTRPSPWTTAAGAPRRAGVSSFGTGGINYHVLIEEHRDGTR